MFFPRHIVAHVMPRGQPECRLITTLAYDLLRHPTANNPPTKTGTRFKLRIPPSPETNDRIILAVLLHGILGNKGNWRSFARKLVRSFPEWQVMLIDHRGHGDSPNFQGPHTISNCAQDVLNLMDHLDIRPEILCGHSFGGKVALGYLSACTEQSIACPESVWVFDALPGTKANDYATRDGPEKKNESSVEFVLPTLKSIPVPIPSKDVLIAELKAKGMSESQALWMTTNVKITPGQATYDWKFDLATIDALFHSFLHTDCWPVLESSSAADVKINLVQAERNKQWSDEILNRFAAIRQENGAVELHVLKNADHWVHVDNPNGLFELLAPELQ